VHHKMVKIARHGYNKRERKWGEDRDGQSRRKRKVVRQGSKRAAYTAPLGLGLTGVQAGLSFARV